MLIAFTQRARRVISLAEDIARRTGADPGNDLPLLIAILEDDGGIAAAVLRELGLKLEPLYRELPTGGASSQVAPLPFEPPRWAIDTRGAAVASEMGAREIGTEHLLLALTCANAATPAARALRDGGVNEARVKATAFRLGFGHDPPPSPHDAIRARIREILLNDWDPHDLARHSDATATAYDAYVEPLWPLISAGDEDAIVAFLRDRERESMCFPGLDTRRLLRPARKLLALRNATA